MLSCYSWHHLLTERGTHGQKKIYFDNSNFGWTYFQFQNFPEPLPLLPWMNSDKLQIKIQLFLSYSSFVECWKRGIIISRENFHHFSLSSKWLCRISFWVHLSTEEIFIAHEIRRRKDGALKLAKRRITLLSRISNNGGIGTRRRLFMFAWVLIGLHNSLRINACIQFAPGVWKVCS